MKFLKVLLSMLLLFSYQFGFSQAKGIDEIINEKFTPFATFIEYVVLYPISIAGVDVPIIVMILSFSGLFFSFYFGFPSITKFGLAIRVVQGKYDDIELAEAKK